MYKLLYHNKYIKQYFSAKIPRDFNRNSEKIKPQIKTHIRLRKMCRIFGAMRGKFCGRFGSSDSPPDCCSVPLGKYGRMRMKYLRENSPYLYNDHFLNGTLNKHCAETDAKAEARLSSKIRLVDKR